MKTMYSVEAATAMVAAEHKKHKQMIIAQAICVGLCTFIFMALYFARLSSANNIQIRTEDALEAA